MTIAREEWQRWSALLDEALDLDDEARKRWLDELRDRDAQAADAVARLLAREDHRTSNQTSLPGTGARYQSTLHRALAAASGDAAKPGQSFGPWQLGRKLGSGGMGEVWLATRADHLYEGQAAIKLLAAHGDAQRLQARFARERQLLARLEHPGIARLLDAGISEGQPENQPYLVLEYIDGTALIDHVRSQALGLAERVRLVLGIGRAVEYAHSRLVIHRDLKPSNVMVTTTGDIKLLDFGIAAFAEQDEEASQLTQLYGRGLTIAYAAPEQIAGEATSVASDVYSLGVILFELIAGTLPLRGATPGRTAHEYAVLHTDAMRLSRALANPLPADAVAGSRPNDHLRALGDLEAIVAKALRKQPRDRYPTMAAFIADLEHWLHHRPVSARRGDWRYRSRLWLRRNRLAAGLTAAVIVSLIAGLGASLWQWQRALQAAHRAEAVQGFLVSLFKAPNNWNQPNGEPTLRSIVEGSAQRIETELAGQPEVQLTLNEVLVETYFGLGDFKSAEAIARSSLQLDDRLHQLTPEHRAYFHNALANILIDRGEYDEGAEQLDQALQVLRARYGENSLQVADVLNDIAAVEASRGKLEESVRLRRKVLSIFEHDSKAAPNEVERIRSDLGVALERAGHWREAAQLQRELVNNSRHDPGSLRYSSGPHNLATVLRRIGRYEESEKLFLNAIEVRRRDAAGHPYLALTLRNYAMLLDDTGRYEQARATLTEALGLLRETYGNDSVVVAAAELRLAVIDARLGDAKADAMARTALSHIGADVPLEQARAHLALGELLLQLGRYAQATTELGSASEAFDRIEGLQHPEAATARGYLGLAELALDRSESRAHLQSAVEALSAEVDDRQSLLLRLREALTSH